jgi:hypothetical protein
MSGLRDRLKTQAEAYAAENSTRLLRFLGDGNDGAVWESSRNTAIKSSNDEIPTAENATRIYGSAIARLPTSKVSRYPQSSIIMIPYKWLK